MTRIPDVFGGPGDQGMQAVVMRGRHLVAVGFDNSGGDVDAAVWSSPEGVVWARVVHDESVLGGPGLQSMVGVAAGGPGLIAVGQDDAGGDSDAAVWTSRDGVTWTRVVRDESVFGGRGTQIMWAVSAGGPGLVAVGTDDSGGDNDMAVWTSRDGVSWTRVAHDESVFGGPGTQTARTVVAGGPGLVAVGWDDSGGDNDAAVWTSRDGVTWTRVAHDESVFGGSGIQSMVGVVAAGPGLVGVGESTAGGDDDAVVWTSPDGLAWTRVTRDVFGGSGNQWMWKVAAGGAGLVAVGQDDSGGDSDVAVWTSPDGSTWTRVAPDEAALGGSGAQTVRGVAVGSSGAVVVGYDNAGTDFDAAVWITAPTAAAGTEAGVTTSTTSTTIDPAALAAEELRRDEEKIAQLLDKHSLAFIDGPAVGFAYTWSNIHPDLGLTVDVFGECMLDLPEDYSETFRLVPGTLVRDDGYTFPTGAGTGLDGLVPRGTLYAFQMEYTFGAPGAEESGVADGVHAAIIDGVAYYFRTGC